MDRIEIKRNRRQQWQMLIIGPFAIYTMVNAMVNMTSKGFMYYMLLIFSSLVLLFFFNAIRQILNRKPALIIDAQGMTDNISIANVGFIPWTNIFKCELKTYMRREHLLVFMKEGENISTGSKKMLEIFERDLGTAVALPVDAMKIKSEELANIVGTAIDDVNNEPETEQ